MRAQVDALKSTAVTQSRSAHNLSMETTCAEINHAITYARPPRANAATVRPSHKPKQLKLPGVRKAIEQRHVEVIAAHAQLEEAVEVDEAMTDEIKALEARIKF